MSDAVSADEYRALIGVPVSSYDEMSSAEYRRLMGEAANDLVPEEKPKSKYGNTKTEVDGHTFDSLAEARHYKVLKALHGYGAIEDLVLQPRYPLVVNGVKVCTYVADFSYIEAATKKRRVVDVKGMKTPMYRLKKKLMLACYGIVVEEVR